MSEALHLFDEAARPPFGGRLEPVTLAARMTDPDTSAKAAQSVTPGRTEAAILAVFGACRRGFTDDELAAWLAPQHYAPTVKTARSRLSKAGLLKDSGLRRKSSRAREMIVWRVA